MELQLGVLTQSEHSRIAPTVPPLFLFNIQYVTEFTGGYKVILTLLYLG